MSASYKSLARANNLSLTSVKTQNALRIDLKPINLVEHLEHQLLLLHDQHRARHSRGASRRYRQPTIYDLIAAEEPVAARLPRDLTILGKHKRRLGLLDLPRTGNPLNRPLRAHKPETSVLSRRLFNRRLAPFLTRRLTVLRRLFVHLTRRSLTHHLILNTLRVTRAAEAHGKNKDQR